jgi:hypothetical protein
MLQVIAGADPADPSSVCAPVADYIGAVHGMHTTLAGGTSTPLKGLRVGLIKVWRKSASRLKGIPHLYV